MDKTTPDQARRMESMIRLGTIAEVDHAAARVRVKSGGLTTDWLPWMAMRAGTTRIWCPPTVGEQVTLLAESGELGTGIVFPGVFSDQIAAPSNSGDEFVIDLPDGARIEYNHATSALKVSGIKTAEVVAAEKVTLDVPETLITGNVTIKGTLMVEQTATIMMLLTYMQGMMGYGGTGAGAGETVIHGPIRQQDGPLSSNGIVLDKHTHTGVWAGGDQTGGPV